MPVLEAYPRAAPAGPADFYAFEIDDYEQRCYEAFDVVDYERMEKLRTAFRKVYGSTTLPPGLMRTPDEQRHFVKGLRKPALKRPMSAAATDQPRTPAQPLAADVDTSVAQAHRNAADAEWAKARSLLFALAQQTLTAAEAGVRLYRILRAVPSLLTEHSSGYCSQCIEGGGGATRVAPDLFPLPFPEPLVLGEHFDLEDFSGRPTDERLFAHGTNAWLALVVAGINAMGGYFFIGTPHGPASEAQLKALNLLKADLSSFRQ